MSPRKHSHRKRGAQPGNTNALRHGFYSKSFWEHELSALDDSVKGEFLDELNVARTNLARLATMMKNYTDMPLDEFIAASNALNNYLDRIQRLSRAQRVMYHNQTTVEQALAELAHLNPDED